MSFVLLFVLASIAFPLSVEIAKNGKENVLTKGSSQAVVFLTESGKVAIEYMGSKSEFFIKPVVTISVNVFSSFNEYIRLAIMIVMGLFCLYFVIQFIIFLFGFFLLLITWLF